MARLKRVHVLLSDEQVNRLKRASSITGTPVAALVRQCIDKFTIELEKIESPLNSKEKSV